MRYRPLHALSPNDALAERSALPANCNDTRRAHPRHGRVRSHPVVPVTGTFSKAAAANGHKPPAFAKGSPCPHCNKPFMEDYELSWNNSHGQTAYFFRCPNGGAQLRAKKDYLANAKGRMTASVLKAFESAWGSYGAACLAAWNLPAAHAKRKAKKAAREGAKKKPKK